MSATIQVEDRQAQQQKRDLPAVRVIPYDYVAEFDLQGDVGRLVQDVINISVEGIFVAVSIGYGLDDERAEALELINTQPDPPSLGEINLSHFAPDLLLEGIRIGPQYRAVALDRNRRLNLDLPFKVAQGIFERLKKPDHFGFLLSIVDTASGRELQNEPVHSVASLGGADGKRPFKMLPQPLVFMPRSTIRLQVEERSAGARGRLYITLQGYKILGLAGGLEERIRRLGDFDRLWQIPVYDHHSGQYRSLGEAVRRDLPSSKIVPFDYVSTLQLEGKPGRLAEDEVPINIDGGYLATSIGYSLDVGDTAVEFDHQTPPGMGQGPDPGESVDLGKFALKNFPHEILFEGIRIHPLRVRFAYGCDGNLARVPREMLGRLFQSANRAEEVRFRFTITDSATGRELQNQPNYNVAGLGIANGDRPFKVLHRPMTFLPRSTIRIQVEEIFGKGRLFIVFQGYKILK